MGDYLSYYDPFRNEEEFEIARVPFSKKDKRIYSFTHPHALQRVSYKEHPYKVTSANLAAIRAARAVPRATRATRATHIAFSTPLPRSSAGVGPRRTTYALPPRTPSARIAALRIAAAEGENPTVVAALSLLAKQENNNAKAEENLRKTRSPEAALKWQEVIAIGQRSVEKLQDSVEKANATAAARLGLNFSHPIVSHPIVALRGLTPQPPPGTPRTSTRPGLGKPAPDLGYGPRNGRGMPRRVKSHPYRPFSHWPKGSVGKFYLAQGH